MTNDSAKRLTEHGSHEDRLELLLFYLGSNQPFGINVLKVKEIIPCPRLTHLPQAHAAVRGVTQLRGHPLTVVDLAQAIGRAPMFPEGCEQGSVIVAEFNRSRQGFLVRRVDRIIVCDWKQVLPPPSGTGLGSYITGVTRVGEPLVQILDVEKIIGEVVDLGEEPTGHALTDEEIARLQGKRVLVVDDSTVARHKTAQTLDQLGVEHVMARDGVEAMAVLKQVMAGEADPIHMVISDIEMPEMDGYTLTREIRKDPNLASLYILLHTSLNGAINTEKAQKAGANDVLTKFVAEDLAHAVARALA